MGGAFLLITWISIVYRIAGRANYLQDVPRTLRGRRRSSNGQSESGNIASDRIRPFGSFPECYVEFRLVRMS